MFSLKGQTGPLRGMPVAPGVLGLISPRLPVRQRLPNGGRVVSATLAAHSRRAGEVQPLPAGALDHYALRAPLVDSAELYLLNVVVPPMRSITCTLVSFLNLACKPVSLLALHGTMKQVGSGERRC
jgi:hypothetical protein